MPKDSLPAHEWIVVILFCAILLILSFYSLMQPNSGKKPPPFTMQIVKKQNLFAAISGAVEFPKEYEMPDNSTLNDLLKIAKTLPDADLSQLKGFRKLKPNEKIVVPFKRMITIYLEGAVREPGAFQVLSGTRVFELIKKIETHPQANLKSLSRSRRYVKEGEIIIIPNLAH